MSTDKTPQTEGAFRMLEFLVARMLANHPSREAIVADARSLVDQLALPDTPALPDDHRRKVNVAAAATDTLNTVLRHASSIL